MDSTSGAHEQSSHCLEFVVVANPPQLEEISQHLQDDVAAALDRGTPAGSSLTIKVSGTAERGAGVKVRAELARGDLQGIHALRSHVLSGDFDVALSTRREGKDAHDNATLTADRTGLVESFEAAASMATASGAAGLTSHQRDTLAECAGQEHVHLTAPAGAGKTLIALQRVLQTLSEPGGKVLFVSRNAALGMFVAGQVVRNFSAGYRRSALRRLHLLHEPLEHSNIQRIGIRERSRLVQLPVYRKRADGSDEGSGSSTKQFSLVVVDEAHHVYGQPAARRRVAELSSGSKLLLLSDISQSRGRDVAYPPGLQEVALTEVVRCSERIVAGAMAFALGGDEKILTRCHHGTTGPPCKSFLFDIAPGSVAAAEARRLDAYANYTCQAIEHAQATFSGLCLHKRLAILLPDRAFANKLRPVLIQKLSARLPGVAVRLVDAVDALAEIGSVVEEKDGNSSSSSDDEATFEEVQVVDESSASDEDEDEEFESASDGGQSSLSLEHGHQHPAPHTVLFDAVDQCDGLERLIIVGVALDAPVEEDGTDGSGPTSADALDTRSRIYRAMTRAQLMVVLVNEFVPGGLLEFLGHIRLRSDQQFDHAAEIARSDVTAVDTIIRSQLASAITSKSTERKLAISPEMVELLSIEAAERREQGEGEGSAVDTVLRRWHRTLEVAGNALVSEFAQHQGMEALTPKERSFAEIAIATALYRDEVPDLTVACSAELKKIRLRRTTQMVDAAIATAVSRGESDRQSIPREALAGLRRRIVAEYSSDVDLASLCNSVVDKWRALQSDIDAAFAACTLQYRCQHGIELPVDAIDSVRADIAAATNGKAVFDTAAVRSATDAAFRACADKIMERKAKEALVAGAKELGILLPCNFPMITSELKPIKYHLIDSAAKQLLVEWCKLESNIREKLQLIRPTCQLHMSDDDMETLLIEISTNIWPRRHDAQDLNDKAVDIDCAKWLEKKKRDLEDLAQIAAELQIAANARRFRLTDAAFDVLQAKVASAVRGGALLANAVAAALQAWEREVVRNQVQQTVWDPSSNSTAKASGVVKFMPFKRTKSEGLDYEMLVSIFRLLSFEELAAASLVCRRWHAVASDPSWQQEVVVYAWGEAEVSGLAAQAGEPRLLQFGMKEQVLCVTCADEATLALTEGGEVFHWGNSWDPECHAEPVPVRLPELTDVQHVCCSPSGYYHGRRDPTFGRFSCAALTSSGVLFTWGRNLAGQLLQGGHELVARPTRVTLGADLLEARVTMIGCGLDYLCIAVCSDEGDPASDSTSNSSKVLTCGRFCREYPHELTEQQPLRGVSLRQLACGSFHCCAVTTRGELYTFGSPSGRDSSNGNLLGTGELRADLSDDDNSSDEDSLLMRQFNMDRAQPPTLVRGIGPVSSVSCSTYLNVAVTVDGHVFTWGDSDGDALGHSERHCHVPHLLDSLRGCRVTRSAASYTNAAVATDQGRLYVWGGSHWEGGISGGRQGPSEVEWDRAYMPQHYRLHSVALAHRHGFLIFRKQP